MQSLIACDARSADFNACTYLSVIYDHELRVWLSRKGMEFGNGWNMREHSTKRKAIEHIHAVAAEMETRPTLGVIANMRPECREYHEHCIAP